MNSVFYLSLFTGERASAFAFAFGFLGFVISVLVASRLGKFFQGDFAKQATTPSVAKSASVATSPASQTQPKVNSAQQDDQAVICAISAAVAMMMDMEYNTAQSFVAQTDPAVGFRIKSIRRVS